MAGFSSLDDFITKTTVDGKFYSTTWNKNALPTTAQTAGMWYDLACGAGSPSSDTAYGGGTNLAFQALDDTSTTSPGIPHGGNVSTDTKHLVNVSAYTAAATTAPCMLQLVDRLGFYRVSTVTTTGNQALDNTVPFPSRHTDGIGLRAYVVCSSGAATTAMGAGTPNISITYTNQAGTGSRTTPTVLPVGTTTAAKGNIVYSGTGAGKYGPFLPLQGPDYGIRSVEQFNLSVTYTSGILNLVICRPIGLPIPITTLGVPGERDYLNQIPSLPRIYDGANLSWLMYAGAATPTNSAIYGTLDFAWG